MFKLIKMNFLIEPFSVLTVSVKFHLTRLSAVACTRFTCIPVYILSNNHMMKLCINSLNFFTQDADGREIKKQIKYVIRAGDLTNRASS